ncbi:MAG: hypothetical protein WBN96_09175 [Gammaproteobacteria bacterium]
MRAVILILLGLANANAHAFFFPEIPFCPLGGPPGWYNRLANHDRYERYPPPLYSPAPHRQQDWYNSPPASNDCGPNNNAGCRWR